MRMAFVKMRIAFVKARRAFAEMIPEQGGHFGFLSNAFGSGRRGDRCVCFDDTMPLHYERLDRPGPNRYKIEVAQRRAALGY
jgi:hypothetical protein